MKNTFEKRRYDVVKSAISKEMKEFITQYALFDELQNYTPDLAQVLNAHAKYADPAMEAMLSQLHGLMESVTNLELLPTYSFYRVYRPGDILFVHTDRPSCEISCTVCFGFKYDDENYRWPIYMEGTAIEQDPGDLAVYRGCDIEHWRNEFIGNSYNDNWHIQGFFHYVDKNGPYSEYIYDKRPSLGLSYTTKS